MSKLDKGQLAFTIATMRRASFRWKARGVAAKASRTPWGFFKNGNQKYGHQCNICKEIFKEKNTVMDHIEPVVTSDGYADIETWISRLLCYEEGWSRLCKPCHDEKSAGEAAERAKKRAEKKAKK